MSKVLKMTFLMEGKKTLTYSLADPKDGLTKAEVETVMQDMITKKAIVETGASPLAIKAAVLRSTEEEALA